MISRAVSPRHWRRILGGVAVLLASLLLLFGGAAWWQTIGAADDSAPAITVDPGMIERGRYLAQIGNCQACHTTVGGAQFAGGRGIPTPFGAVYSSNLTPDIETGIGAWSSEAFWRAMHQGRSRDGRLLYPAFPYPNTTLVTRPDSDAIHAWLRSLPAVRQANRAHALRFPYNTQIALAAWRLLFFRAADHPSEDAVKVATNPPMQRGAYLVNGLGHCSACHGKRNLLGGSSKPWRLDGGLMPGDPWYAPSLLSRDEAGVGDWSLAQIVALLSTGQSDLGSVQGPMAEVVLGSSQHLSPEDAMAVAVYLRSLGSAEEKSTIDPAPAASEPSVPEAQETTHLRGLGADLYEKNCADCHGLRGEGIAGAYPALSGNRAMLLDPPVNLIQMILHGGFGPTTAGNPRPFGMPPYGITLTQTEIAALVTFIRGAWGNNAAAVSVRDVQAWREAASPR